MESATSTNRAREHDAAAARDPEASDVALTVQISAAGIAKSVEPRSGSRSEGRRLTDQQAPLETAEPDAGAGERGDPEARDAALSERITSNEGSDPAAAELREAAVTPVGLAPVDVVATPPRTGAAPAPGGPLPGRWLLTDAEIRPIILGVCLAMFVSALNQTIVATTLPTIGREFNDFENLSWLITAYLLTSTVAAPLFGKLSDIYGRRAVMLSALGIFIVGSIACVFAPNMLLLILCRGLQGLGGGGIVPLVQATVADAVAPRERGRYQAYIGAVWIVAGTLGPVTGGYVADHLHWSVVFWLNVPLGLAAAFMTYRNLTRLPRHDRKHKLDLTGALLMMSAAILLLLVLTWGGGRFPWTSPQILGLLAGSAALWLAFVWRLTHTDEPFLPLTVLANPVVRAGTLAASCGIGSQIGLTVFMPLFYENVHGLSASGAG
jgi:MFS family permease